MATLPAPVSVGKVDANLTLQVSNLAALQTSRATAIQTGGALKWMMPLNPGKNSTTPLSTVLTNYVAVGNAFNRDEANQTGAAAQNPQKPGMVGDITLAALQVDYLGTMERAFRSRMLQGRCRSLAHASARFGGHGCANGPLTQCVLGFLRSIDQETKRVLPS